MFKALLKKQFMEINAWLIQDKKKGKRRSVGGMVLLLLLYVFLFGWLGVVFFGMGVMICEPMIAIDLGWFYFAVMALASVLLGVFGSVFNTFATLYKAKDNEFLLSMPVPPAYILAARLLGVWFWSLIYSALVFIPAVIAYLAVGGFKVSAAVSGVLAALLISVFVLTLSCVLGWAVAKISTKLKNKSFVTVLLSLIFIGVYYFGYSKAYGALQSLAENAAIYGEKVRGSAYPLYLLGKACTGDFLSLALFALMIFLLFAIVYFVMSRSFIKMAVSNYTVSKAKGKKISAKARGVRGALLIKEFRRFVTSPTYMLNCGLGTVIILVLGVFALIKSDVISGISVFIGSDVTALLACAVLCMTASMNDITAPSVSLEGRNLWILQSMPVPAHLPLFAKLETHIIVTGIPVFVCAVCLSFALALSPLDAVMLTVISELFVLLSAAFGLFVNLKMPNLNWTDETVPVKQSVGVVLALFGGWVFIIALGFLYYLLHAYISVRVYMIIAASFLAVLSLALVVWIKKRGSRIFAAL